MSVSKQIAFIAGGILVSAISGYLTASWAVHRSSVKPSDKISAHELVLVDEAGHVGARLAWKDGQPQIQLFDRNNRMRSALFLEPNGVPDLYLYDEKNAVRAALNLFDSGVPNLAFLDESQKHMVLTEYDQQQSYNTVFEEFDNAGHYSKIAVRKMMADGSGLHVLDTRKPAAAK
jgi:hypothetical protein